jgi:hypothetical protein
MPSKKIDLKESIQRERTEPKIKSKSFNETVEKKEVPKEIKSEQPFDIQLKIKPTDEIIKLDVKNAELGMTEDEVIKVAGKPSLTIEWYSGNLKYKYGNVWIVFENGSVTCLVRAKHFEKYWSRHDYQGRNPEALIK